MAKNSVFPYTESQVEVWPVDNTTAPGTPLLSAGGQPGVALTGSGDYTASTTIGPFTISGYDRGGVGLDAKQVSTATDGTWEFPVVGGTATTAQNTPVFFKDGALSLTADGAKPFGKVNLPQDYVVNGTTLPVKIGVFA